MRIFPGRTGPAVQTYRSFFGKLFLSYSTVNLLPLLLVWLILLVSGTRLVITIASNRGDETIQSLALSLGARIDDYSAIGARLAAAPIIQDSLATPPGSWSSQQQLDFYTRLFAELQGNLYSLEVHLTSFDGRVQLSSHSYPARYDLTNFRNTQETVFDFQQREPVLYINPYTNTRGQRVAFSRLYRLERGFMILDILASPVIDLVRTQFFDSIILADTKTYQLFSVYQPDRAVGFADHTELGILFSEDFTRLRDERILVKRHDVLPGISLVGILNLHEYFVTLREIVVSGLVILALAVLLTLAMTLRVSRAISRPIHAMVQAMGGHQKVILPGSATARQDETAFLIKSYNTMVDEIDDLLERVREEEQALRLAERKALQAQINPHFINNTLGAIKSMAKLSDMDAVVTIVNHLGKILRFTMNDIETMVPLERAIDFVARYLAIQKIRYQDRMITAISLPDECRDILVPKLIIQPIVENAIIHGVEKTARQISIAVRCSRSAEGLLIDIEDDSLGIRPPEGGLPATGRAPGIGLANVRKRLELIYQGSAGLTIESPWPPGAVGGTKVRIAIPLALEMD
jgi:two-component system sensor histidine kinase YesM